MHIIYVGIDSQAGKYAIGEESIRTSGTPASATALLYFQGRNAEEGHIPEHRARCALIRAALPALENAPGMVLHMGACGHSRIRRPTMANTTTALLGAGQMPVLELR